MKTYAVNLAQGHIDELNSYDKELVGMLIFALLANEETARAAQESMEELRIELDRQSQSWPTGS